jgi:hypothetical protein
LERPLPAFPFPIEACRGEEALLRLARLREQGRRDGFTALVIGDDDDVESLAELPQFNEITPEEYLRLAESIDVAAWFEERRSEEPEEFEVGLGEWPTNPKLPRSIVAHADIMTGRPKPRVYLTRLPTAQSWKVPALLRLGNWNECPEAQDHVALARSWHERFGAEIVAVTRDTVEFEVARPPKSRAEAEQLAWEQFIYCTDIVHRGLETIRNLAGCLLNGKYWQFWWD